MATIDADTRAGDRRTGDRLGRAGACDEMLDESERLFARDRPLRRPATSSS